MEHAAVHVDVSDATSVDGLFKDIRNLDSKPVSILVNCAGIGAADASISETSTEVFERITNVNLKVSSRRRVPAVFALLDKTGERIFRVRTKKLGERRSVTD